MIKLQDAGPASVLPAHIKRDADIQAVSYAFQMGMRKLLCYAAISTLYGDIDALPGFLLDFMAVELQSQYYEESLALEIKREIIRNSLAWYSKSGTVSAVEELILVIFGKGELEEWFQFGGTPGTFRIRLQLGEFDVPINVYDVWKKIRRYKKSSAHLVGIRIGYCFRIPIRYRNAITFRSAFYPRFNLQPLNLDGLWVLDGRQSLDGYSETETVDLHPVGVAFLSSVRVHTREAGRLHIQSKTGIRTGAAVAVRLSGEADHGIKPAECLRMRASTACPIGTKAVMHKENIMDDTWVLDGGRILDGGGHPL